MESPTLVHAKAGIVTILQRKGGTWDEELLKELVSFASDLNQRGLPKKEIIELCTQLILSDETNDGQQDLLEIFVERSTGWCSPLSEIRWPEDQ